MKIEILEEKENKPLARREITFKVEHTGGTTPSRADIRSKIVAQFDADEARVVISSLVTKFGSGVAEGTARIYDSPELMQKVEQKYILARHGGEKEES